MELPLQTDIQFLENQNKNEKKYEFRLLGDVSGACARAAHIKIKKIEKNIFLIFVQIDPKMKFVQKMGGVLVCVAEPISFGASPHCKVNPFTP